MTRTDLAIVIVSYNTREDLRRALASLHAAPPAVVHQVVVVDNGSVDGSLSMVAECWPRVLRLDAGGNVGFSRANNLGIRATDSELVLLLNSDTVVPAGAIDRLVQELRAHPGAAAIGPRLVDAEGRPELSVGRMMSPVNELRQKIVGALYDRDTAIGRRLVGRLLRHPREVDWVSGACLLVRRSEAEAVGLLDERYFLYTEDVDFCAALRARGQSVRYTPAVEIRHLRGRSRAHDPASSNAAYRRSHLAFYAKHHPRWHRVLKLYLRVKGQVPEEDGNPGAEHVERNT